MTNDIREQWEAKKAAKVEDTPSGTVAEQWAERKANPQVLPPLRTTFTVDELNEHFNARPGGGSTWWEYCQDNGMSFQQAIEPLVERLSRQENTKEKLPQAELIR